MAKILFLAQFAPTNGKEIEPKSPEEKFYAETYHLPICNILDKYGYDYVASSDINELIQNHSKYDLVWSVYNRLGFRNCEIFVQSICEYYNVPYIGAAPNVRALVEDKSMSKQLAEHLAIPTAKWVTASSKYPLSIIAPFNGPYFVKPRFGSASIGIDESCLCETWLQAREKANCFFKQNIEVIVEEYINGIYYGVPILDNTEKPLIATPHFQTSDKIGNIITNSQKRFTESGMKRFMCQDNGLSKILKYYSQKYFMEIQPCDYARIDYIVEQDTGIPYFLEVNTLMNLGQKGGFIASFLEHYFNSYDDIIQYIIQLGLLKIKK